MRSLGKVLNKGILNFIKVIDNVELFNKNLRFKIEFSLTDPKGDVKNEKTKL